MNKTANVTIYTSAFCPYCVWAKRLLATKDIADINEIRIDQDPSQIDTMVERAGGRTTVPQIFIGDHHVGGYDDMADLEREGRLDPLLEQVATANG